MKVPSAPAARLKLELQFAVLMASLLDFSDMAITKLDRVNALILIWTVLRCCFRSGMCVSKVLFQT